MTTLLRTLPVALFMLILAACGGEAETPAQENGGAAASSEITSEAAASQRAQTVEITAGPNGYEPQQITLEAGQPARLVFTRTADSSCLHAVKIPALGVEATDLPIGEPVAVTVTPQETGTFQFICGMNMQKGTIAVQAS